VRRDGVGRLANDLCLVVRPFPGHELRIGAAMSDDFVLTAPYRLEDFGMVLIEHAVDVVRCGQLQLVEEAQQAPDAHPVAVITPRVVALGGR
jgi:hypothetical protein